MIKKVYFLILFIFLKGLSSSAQVENKQIRTYIKPTKEEEGWLRDAANLYVEFTRNVADAPKHQINIDDIIEFVENRFENSAYIEVEGRNGTSIPDRKSPLRYFNNLRGRYNGTYIDSTSKIVFRNFIEPYIDEDTEDLSHIVRCKVKIIMIDRRNGIDISTNQEPKIITITFKKISGYRTPKIKYIKVDQ